MFGGRSSIGRTNFGSPTLENTGILHSTCSMLERQDASRLKYEEVVANPASQISHILRVTCFCTCDSQNELVQTRRLVAKSSWKTPTNRQLLCVWRQIRIPSSS